MTAEGRPAILYALSPYVSHRVAGLANRRALADAGYRLVHSAVDADVVLIHDEPPAYPSYFRANPAIAEKYVVAFAVWETDRLPKSWRFHLSLADEIWTPSAHSRAALLEVTDRVVVVPHVVVPPDYDEVEIEALWKALPLPREGFRFYSIDASLDGSNPRKNVAAIVAAFDGLFAPEEQVRLVLKTRVPLANDLERVPGVIGLSGFCSQLGPIGALHHVGDCFVSAHRAEGWGLSMSDAMAAGNLVVATGHSGNMQFMNNANSVPVRYSMVRVNPAQHAASPLFSTSMSWAEVDEHDLRKRLRCVYDNWASLQPVRSRAKTDMAQFSSDRVGELMSGRLSEIVRRL